MGLVGLEDFLEIATPSFTESLSFGQFLNPPSPQNEDALSFFQHSRLVITMMAIGCLIILLVSLFFEPPKSKLKANQTGFRKETEHRIRLVQKLLNRTKRFLFNVTQTGGCRVHRLTRYNVVMLAYFVFLMISVSIFRSLVKTNGVIINLSEVIDSKAKLLATRRYHCGFSQESTHDYLRLVRKQNYLSKVLSKRRPDGDCYLDFYFENPGRIQEFEFTRAFLILSKITLTFILSYFSQMVQQKIVFESTFLGNEIIQAHLVSGFLESRLKAKLHYK